MDVLPQRFGLELGGIGAGAVDLAGAQPEFQQRHAPYPDRESMLLYRELEAIDQ